jgi:hypothetical protein
MNGCADTSKDIAAHLVGRCVVCRQTDWKSYKRRR